MNTGAASQRFRALFGCERQQMGPGLVVSPFLDARLAARYMQRPDYFHGAVFRGVHGRVHGRPVSFVRTGMGHPLAADCVLAQDSQRVRQIVFVGAVGAWQHGGVGDTVLIRQAFFDLHFYRQFTGFHSGSIPPEYAPEEALVLQSEQMARAQRITLKRLRVASVNSLWQQEDDMVPRLQAAQAQGVDLECALVYAAAARIEVPAVALAVVTDIPGARPYWGTFSPAERRVIARNMRRLLQLCLCLAATPIPAA